MITYSTQEVRSSLPVKMLGHKLIFILLGIAISISPSIQAKVAVVTGANKGVGYGIVKGLCEKYNGHVYLTSRDETRGIEAVNKLKKLGLNPLYHQLDVTDLASIQKFRDYINRTEGGIDILVNNAAVAYFHDQITPFEEQVENIMKINYFGLLQVSEILSPLLKRNARVVNVSSGVGVLSSIPSKELRGKIGNRSLTISQLNSLMNEYTGLAKQGKHKKQGWPSYEDSPYVVSKIGVSALTFIQQRNFDSESEKRNIVSNCVHPGYVDTDLTDHRGPLSLEQGASAPLHLALANHNLRGKFLLDNLRILDFYGQ